MQDFVDKKTLKKANNLSPLSTSWLNLVFYAEQMIIWFLIIMFKISVWGHVCRHSRIRTYNPITIWAQWDATSLSTDRHTASVVQHNHFSSGYRRFSSLPQLIRCAASHSWKPFGGWKSTHRVEPLAGSILRGSSELYCSAPFPVQPEASNGAWPKYLELITEWKERILVVRSCKNSTVVLVVRSIEFSCL